MKAHLIFNLPEEEPEHKYALAGADALLAIEDLLNEIRSFLKYGAGEFGEFKTEVWNDDTEQYETKTVSGCQHTLEKVSEYLYELKQSRRLPELV
jgi:hypothetical protein